MGECVEVGSMWYDWLFLSIIEYLERLFEGCDSYLVVNFVFRWIIYEYSGGDCEMFKCIVIIIMCFEVEDLKV